MPAAIDAIALQHDLEPCLVEVYHYLSALSSVPEIHQFDQFAQWMRKQRKADNFVG